MFRSFERVGRKRKEKAPSRPRREKMEKKKMSVSLPHLVRVDALGRLLAVKVLLKQRLDFRDARAPANEHDLVDVGLFEVGVLERLAHGAERLFLSFFFSFVFDACACAKEGEGVREKGRAYGRRAREAGAARARLRKMTEKQRERRPTFGFVASPQHRNGKQKTKERHSPCGTGRR